MVTIERVDQAPSFYRWTRKAIVSTLCSSASVLNEPVGELECFQTQLQTPSTTPITEFQVYFPLPLNRELVSLGWNVNDQTYRICIGRECENEDPANNTGNQQISNRDKTEHGTRPAFMQYTKWLSG